MAIHELKWLAINWMIPNLYHGKMVGNHQTSTLNWLFGVPGACLIGILIFMVYYNYIMATISWLEMEFPGKGSTLQDGTGQPLEMFIPRISAPPSSYVIYISWCFFDQNRFFRAGTLQKQKVP